MRILVVDDSEEARSLLAAALGEGGFEEVMAAGTAKEAFSYLGVDSPTSGMRQVDLVLMDVGLPEVDGITAIHRIRAVRTRRSIPIIVITGCQDEGLIEDAFAAGATDFITKPFRAKELLCRVNAALRLKKERDRRITREHTLVNVAKALEQRNQSLAKLAQKDTLTGIANRRHFRAVFGAEWRRAARAGSQLSLIMADVDFFHEYNEAYGHLEGDAALRQIAAVMAGAASREADCVARYGGEEFAVVLPATAAEGAKRVGEAIRAGVEAMRLPHLRSRCGEVVTISVGVATMLPAPEIAPEALIAAADEALYRAKEQGRNRIEIAELGDTRAAANEERRS